MMRAVAAARRRLVVTAARERRIARCWSRGCAAYAWFCAGLVLLSIATEDFRHWPGHAAQQAGIVSFAPLGSAEPPIITFQIEPQRSVGWYHPHDQADEQWWIIGDRAYRAGDLMGRRL